MNTMNPEHIPMPVELDERPLFAVENLVIEVKKGGIWTPIINDVSFAVRPGEVVALIGESGSGKTTLALAALGYTKPGCHHKSGRAMLGDTDLFTLDAEGKRTIRGNRVAYLAQSAAAAFNPARTIGEQVTESAVIHAHMSLEDAEKHALELYRALDLPNPDTIARRYPHEVSGGQLQRLMAAMALCSRPELLVLDEPTTALDVTTQIEVLQSFKKVIKAQNAAAIYITHDLALVAQIADHAVVLRLGIERESGPIGTLIDQPKDAYTKKLMAAVGRIEGVEGRELEDNCLLKIDNVSAGYGSGISEIQILWNINLAIKKGETVGVIGESGCGKSTLARVVSGALPAREGQVLHFGEVLPPARKSRSMAQLRKIQFVFQMADTALNPKQTISSILGRPLETFLGLKGQARDTRVRELLELVELHGDFANRYPAELSGGQKQRVNLARALAAEPDIVLCDEVTSALDVVVAASVIKLLKNLREKLELSYMFISHDQIGRAHV